PRWDLTVGVDTTRTEVVDVQVTGSDSAAFTACVEDAAWDLELDDRFAPFTRHYNAAVVGSR
ncbi:MAG TPA: hypothetical protein VL463_07425, partial [Kofleriaceae bacterium]|nr:hypothetical protein [Kofleriaceae bacterium]